MLSIIQLAIIVLLAFLSHQVTVIPIRTVQQSSCPPEVPLSRPILVNWITNPNLSDLRTNTGTTGLDTTQIVHLVAPQDTIACNSLRTQFPLAISATIGSSNDRLNDLTYYKVGNFYFVTIVTAPSSDSTIVRVGYQRIYIFDTSFNYVAGYSG
jgi:hypothetical protein